MSLGADSLNAENISKKSSNVKSPDPSSENTSQIRFRKGFSFKKGKVYSKSNVCHFCNSVNWCFFSFVWWSKSFYRNRENYMNWYYVSKLFCSFIYRRNVMSDKFKWVDDGVTEDGRQDRKLIDHLFRITHRRKRDALLILFKENILSLKRKASQTPRGLFVCFRKISCFQKM